MMAAAAAAQLLAAASREIASGSRLPFTHPLPYRSLGAARPALSARCVLPSCNGAKVASLLHFQHAGEKPAQLCETVVTCNRMPTTLYTGNYTDCPKQVDYNVFRLSYITLLKELVQAGVQVALPTACGARLL